MKLIKQALSIDPNDTDVLLVLASLVKEATRKRHVLNHILAVAPAHEAARQMLSEMDRAQMSTYHFKLDVSPASLAALQSSPEQVYERLQPTTRLDSLDFSESETFRKRFLKQYGPLFALVPMCLLFLWLGLGTAELHAVFLVASGVCALLMLIPLFQVSAITVEPNRLTVETFFEEKEFTAREIREIKMQAVRGRYGRVANIINIIPWKGKNYPLGSFPEGEEILYGFLMNWWNRYQNK
jgi:hypothetical protein